MGAMGFMAIGFGAALGGWMRWIHRLSGRAHDVLDILGGSSPAIGGTATRLGSSSYRIAFDGLACADPSRYVHRALARCLRRLIGRRYTQI